MLIGTAYLAHVADLFARMAHVVGAPDDASQYASFASRVGEAFQRRFVRSDGTLSTEIQTAYAIALAFGLIPESLRSAADDRLTALVLEADTHVATGFLGTPLVMPALTDTATPPPTRSKSSRSSRSFRSFLEVVGAMAPDFHSPQSSLFQALSRAPARLGPIAPRMVDDALRDAAAERQTDLNVAAEMDAGPHP